MRREMSVQVARETVQTLERGVPSAGRSRHATRKRSFGRSTSMSEKIRASSSWHLG